MIPSHIEEGTLKWAAIGLAISSSRFSHPPFREISKTPSTMTTRELDMLKGAMQAPVQSRDYYAAQQDVTMSQFSLGSYLEARHEAKMADLETRHITAINRVAMSMQTPAKEMESVKKFIDPNSIPKPDYKVSYETYKEMLEDWMDDNFKTQP